MNKEEAREAIKEAYGNSEYTDEIIKALEQELCDTCGYEEGSIYCKEHCPHEAKVEQEPKTDSWSIKDVVDTFKKHGLIREQEPCEDAISRKQAIYVASGYCHPANVAKELAKLPPVTPQPKTGHCKDCKYFEYNSVAKVDGVPLIVAHEICSRWGDGCKTKEDGYCFLFEPQERSE